MRNLKKCITCGRKLHDQATFCDSCGSEQPTQPSPPAYTTQHYKPGRCVRCGRKLHDQARFCDRCGSEQPTEPYSPYITPSMTQRKLTGRDIFKVFMYSWLNQAA